jgi:hypothetical protein
VALLSDTEDSDTHRNVAGTLCNLAFDNTENQTVIRGAGGVDALIKLLVDESVDVRIQAAAALSKRGLNASAEEGFECQLRIGEETGANEKQDQVITCTNPSDALSALISCISDEALAAKHISWLVPCVMLLFDANVTVRRKASIAMAHFCKESWYHEVIRDVNGVVALDKLLSDSDADIVMNASNALAALT